MDRSVRKTTKRVWSNNFDDFCIVTLQITVFELIFWVLIASPSKKTYVWQNGTAQIQKFKHPSQSIGHHILNIRCICGYSLQRSKDHIDSYNLIQTSTPASKCNSDKLDTWWVVSHSWIHFGANVVHYSGQKAYWLIFTLWGKKRGNCTELFVLFHST